MTNLAEQLRGAGLHVPTEARAHLGLVLPAVADALGAGRGPHDAAARKVLGLEPAARVVVVLVDGLGARNLAERSGHAPFLRRLLAADDTGLVCGFPSTTTTSLGLFGTGRPGGRTGLVGYAVRNPATGELGNFVRWEGVPAPEDWQHEPSLLTHVARAGVAVTSIGAVRFAGSGLTRAVLDGGRYVAVEPLADRVDAALAALRSPGLVYLYWGEVDRVGHQLGARSAEWGAALEETDAEIARLARSVPAGTELIVTADHGMVDVDPAARVDLARHEVLARDVEVLGGEPRAPHVYLRAGVDPVWARDAWREVLGTAGVVATRAEAVEAGWFGEVAPHVRPAIGDLVVATTGRATIVDSVGGKPGLLTMVGVHGSLTPVEVELPFLRVSA